MPSSRRRILRRHLIPLFAYGFVSFFLLFMGCIFSGFAIFNRTSILSKIWLAGPTTMAVGLVLCGKVIIDCRPTRNDDEEADEEDNLQENCQKSKFMEQQQLDKVRDSLITISKIRAQYKSMPDDDMVEEDSCPDYNSTVWNVRTDNSNEDNTTILEDNSLCLRNSYAKLSTTDETTTRNCPICVISVQETNSGHYEHGENSEEAQSLLSTSPKRIKSSTSPSPSHHTHMDSLLTQHKTNHTENSPSKLASSSHSPLYQGEIFLYNDRQYLI